MSAPIDIASKRSSASASSSLSSSLSSPSSSLSSSSSSGVYVPVHRRTPSVPQIPQRTLPIYTPAELTALAQSPLVKQLTAATHAALHQEEDHDVFAEIAMSRRQQRTREYMARKEEAEARHQQNQNQHQHHQQQQLKAVVAAPPTPTPTTTHRRPVAHAHARVSPAPAQHRWNAYASTNKFVDATASWRPAVVSLAI
ncbi:hypothetical protein FB45DRAFT_478865 [Roridomyces roridus]|uniref:Uncharacterized protein n=1 Tax=Roridomyces roridus TaxID=1738132 RepID=A0AAD7BZP7_9AGAR|nr:hypothetical protein FB45DRAFT_478865 [Roridomyces roridus]